MIFYSNKGVLDYLDEQINRIDDNNGRIDLTSEFSDRRITRNACNQTKSNKMVERNNTKTRRKSLESNNQQEIGNSERERKCKRTLNKDLAKPSKPIKKLKRDQEIVTILMTE